MPLLTSRQVAQRYNVVLRSVDRWVHDPDLGFPKPIKIRDRNYYDEAELDAFDRRRADARHAEVA